MVNWSRTRSRGGGGTREAQQRKFLIVLGAPTVVQVQETHQPIRAWYLARDRLHKTHAELEKKQVVDVVFDGS